MLYYPQQECEIEMREEEKAQRKKLHNELQSAEG